MSLSMNEVMSLARKAARGAGLSWGMAEEAGYACQWLERRGLPGATVLLTALGGDLSRCATAEMPSDDELRWSGQGALLSPLQVGPAIADNAADIAQTGLAILDVAYPLLLVPHAHRLSCILSRDVRLTWPDCSFGLDSDGQGVLIGENIMAAGPVVARIDVSHSPGFGTVLEDHKRVTLDAEVQSGLEMLAARTYAPATEASRLRGAGDGS